MSGLDRALQEAAKRIGGASNEWLEISGPECGVGVDFWFVQRIDRDDESIEYILNVNRDQTRFTWELTADNDDESQGFGEFDEDEE